MAVRKAATPLPGECFRVWQEGVKLLALLQEAIARGEAAGVDMTDATEIGMISQQRLEQIRITFYPDAPKLSWSK